MEENFPTEDAMLTAYALGELEGADLATVEARLAADPAARAAVQEIRAFELRMKAALAHEAVADASSAQPQVNSGVKRDRYVKPSRRLGKIFEFPQLYFVATAMAAACFLIIFLQPHAERRTTIAQAKHYQEVDLTGASPVILAPAETSVAAANGVELQPFSAAKQESAANKKIPPFDKDAKEADEEKARDRRMVARETAAPAPLLRDQIYGKDSSTSEKAKTLAYANFRSSSFAQQRPESALAMSGFISEPKVLDAIKNSGTRADAARQKADRPAPVGVGAASRPQLASEHAFMDAKNFPATQLSWPVSTESWTTVQSALEAGRKPMPDSVRIEELLQKFSPTTGVNAGAQPFSAQLEVASAPWAANHRLARATLFSGARAPGSARSGNALAAVVTRDVKLTVEFNPATVASYRLIGFENAAVDSDGVQPDLLNAVVVNPGEAVTALFEIVPAPGLAAATRPVAKATDALFVVKVDYHTAEQNESRQQSFSLRENETDFAHASPDFKFAAAVAGFGMILRESPYRGTATFKDVISWAHESISDGETESRTHLIDLAKKADELGQ